MNGRGLFLSWYMCLSSLMVKMPVRKTGDLRFKSQLRHKFFSQYLSSIWTTLYEIFNINAKIVTPSVNCYGPLCDVVSSFVFHRCVGISSVTPHGIRDSHIWVSGAGSSRNSPVFPILNFIPPRSHYHPTHFPPFSLHPCLSQRLHLISFSIQHKPDPS